MSQITNIGDVCLLPNVTQPVENIHELVKGNKKRKSNKQLFDGNKDFNEIWKNVVKRSEENGKKNNRKQNV